MSMTFILSPPDTLGAPKEKPEPWLGLITTVSPPSGFEGFPSRPGNIPEPVNTLYSDSKRAPYATVRVFHVSSLPKFNTPRPFRASHPLFTILCGKVKENLADASSEEEQASHPPDAFQRARALAGLFLRHPENKGISFRTEG